MAQSLPELDLTEFGGESLPELDLAEFGDAPEELGAWNTAKAVGKQIADIPEHLAGAAAAAYQGEDIPTGDEAKESISERLIQNSRELAERRAAELPRGAETAIPFFKAEDIQSLGPSLGFSSVGIVAGIGAGAPASVATPAAGLVAGGVASGVAAYRMSKNQFLHDLKEKEEKKLGRPLTSEEYDSVRMRNEVESLDYGAAEAIPEAIGNVIDFVILRGKGSGFGKTLVTRAAKKLASMYGTEVATETITQQIQQRQESIAGLTPDEQRSYTDLHDWWSSFKEVAAPTILQTTLTAGAGGAASMAYDRLKSKQPSSSETQPAPTTDPADTINRVLSTPETGDSSADIDATIAAMNAEVGASELITTETAQEAAQPIVTPEPSTQPIQEAANVIPESPANTQPDLRNGVPARVEIRPAAGIGEGIAPEPGGIGSLDDRLAAAGARPSGEPASEPAQPVGGAEGGALTTEAQRIVDQTIPEQRSGGLEADSKASFPSEQDEGGVAPARVAAAPDLQSIIKPEINTLIKRKAAAKQIGMGAHLVVAINKAKAAMESGKGSPAEFKKLSKRFKGKDDQTHAALLNIANALEPMKPAQKKSQKTSSDLLQRIKQLGGIDASLALDITGEKRGVGGWKFAFKKGGTGLDDLATQLADDGFMIDTGDVDGGVQQLRDMIRSHINGERNFKAVTVAAALENESARRNTDALAQHAEGLGINWRGLSEQQLLDAVYMAEDALEMERMDAEELSDAAIDASDAIVEEEIDVPFGDEGETDNAALEAWLGGDDEQTTSGNTSEGAGTRAQESAEAVGGAARQEAGTGQEVLQSHAAAEVAQREAAKDAQERRQEEKKPDILPDTKQPETAPQQAKAQDKIADKSTQEQQATAILDRANVTGKERLDIMRDFKDGKHSLADLEKAYPGKTATEPILESTRNLKEQPIESAQAEQPAEVKPQGATQLKYAKPSTIDTPAQGVLNQAKEGKARAWAQVKSLRERIQNEPLNGNRSGLRIELMKAEDHHREYQRNEKEALAAIEKRANELGLTTIQTKETDKGVALFSLGDSANTGGVDLATPQTIESVTKATAKLRARWLGFRRVKIVQSVKEIPNELYLRALRAARPIAQDSEGIYDPKTKTVYLIADNIASPERGVWVAVHEVVGHGGIRMLGSPVVDALNFAGKNGFVKKLAKAIAEDRGETFDATTHTDEAIAELAAATITGDMDTILDRYDVIVPVGMRNNLDGMIKRAIQAIRDFIRKVLGKPPSDEAIQALLRKMRKAVEGKAQHNAMSSLPNRALASTPKAQDQTQTEAFRKWFGNSKVVDADGKPLVVYHGTTNDIGHVFDTRGDDIEEVGAFFTTSAEAANMYAGDAATVGGNVSPAYLSIKKPYVVTNEQWAEAVGLSPQQAKDSGYDGYVITGMNRGIDKADTYIAFEPTQIKSAIGNRGTFDQNDSNILASRPAQQPIPGTPQPPAQPPRKGKPTTPSGKSIQDAIDAGRPLGHLLSMFDRNQIVQLYGDNMPELNDYKRAQEQIVADRNSLMYGADDLLNTLYNLSPQARDQFASIAHEATIEGFDPSKDYIEPDKIKELARLIKGLEQRKKESGLTEKQEKLLAHSKKLIAANPGKHAELRKRFLTMPKDARAAFTALRDKYRDTATLMFNELEARIERLSVGEDAKRNAIADLRLEHDRVKNSIYFPLARFGNHVVIGIKDGSKQVEYYESEKKAKEAAARMVKDGYQTRRTTRKTYSETLAKEQAISNIVESVKGLRNTKQADAFAFQQLDALLDNINQAIIQMVPDGSYRRHFAHRKNTPGYSADFIRAYADSMWKVSNHISNLRHSDAVSGAIKAMQERVDNAGWGGGDVSALQDVVNHLIRREEELQKPTSPVAATIAQGGFLAALASTSNFFVNLTQTPVLTFPWMGARYGYTKASMQFSRALMTQMAAFKKANSLREIGHAIDLRNKLKGDELAIFERLHQTGKVDVTQAHDLIDAANNDTPMNPDSTWNTVMRIGALPQHLSEVFNRQISAIVATRLELAKSGDKEAAFEAAVAAIDNTHYDYEKSNRPMMMHGNWQRVVFMFKQYAQKTAYLWARTAWLAMKGQGVEKSVARKQLAGMVGMQFAVSGVLGLPIFLEAAVVAGGVAGFRVAGKTGAYTGVTLVVLAAVAAAMGDDDEDDFDTEVRQWFAEKFGNTWGEVLTRGVVRMTGIDIAGRVNADEFFIRKPDASVEGKDYYTRWVEAGGGFVLGYGGNVALGLSMMSEGKVYRGLEKMIPVKQVRDAMTAIRFEREGATNLSGNNLLKGSDPDSPTLWEETVKAVGFQPARIAEVYEANASVKNAERILNNWRQDLLDRRWEAISAKDQDEVKHIDKKIKEFNKEHPTHKITGETKIKSIVSHRKAEKQSEHGIRMSRKHEELRDKADYANR